MVSCRLAGAEQAALEDKPCGGGIGQLGNIHELFEQLKQIEAVVLAAVLEVCFKFAATDVVFQLCEIVYRKHLQSFASAAMQRWVRSWAICSTC